MEGVVRSSGLLSAFAGVMAWLAVPVPKEVAWTWKLASVISEWNGLGMGVAVKFWPGSAMLAGRMRSQDEARFDLRAV